MTHIKKQILIGLGAGVVLIVILGAIKYFQISAAIAQQMSQQQPPEAVTSSVTKSIEWKRKIRAVGSLAAVQGATLATELSGTVSEIFFESGDYVEAGKKLVQLDVSVEQANLRGARAIASEADKLLERAQLLRKKNANSLSDLDAAVAKAAQAKAEVMALESTVAKKTIIAPFAGHTGIRKVNLGEFVTEGEDIVPLFALDTLHVDFDLPQSALPFVKEGAQVLVYSDDLSAEIEGSIASIDPNINPNTRNFSVQALVKNEENKLRPGMYVTLEVDTGLTDVVIPVPQSSIVYAPYGNSIWIIETKKAEDGTESKVVSQQFVKLGSARGDLIAVTSGLEADMEIVSSGGFKLRPGASVVVNNSVTPTSSENPTPPNT